ncbi:MAG: hypothetical protein WB715_10520 [Roseiarcus sp.]|uniref:hypothetical protein n=1 Tax=Roseiarcus sp. TaxID=1969460 RepID=UPI003C3FABE0
MMTAQERWDQRQRNLPPARRSQATIGFFRRTFEELKRQDPSKYYQFVYHWEQCWGSIKNYEPMKEEAK